MLPWCCHTNGKSIHCASTKTSTGNYQTPTESQFSASTGNVQPWYVKNEQHATQTYKSSECERNAAVYQLPGRTAWLAPLFFHSFRGLWWIRPFFVRLAILLSAFCAALLRPSQSRIASCEIYWPLSYCNFCCQQGTHNQVAFHLPARYIDSLTFIWSVLYRSRCASAQGCRYVPFQPKVSWQNFPWHPSQ